VEIAGRLAIRAAPRPRVVQAILRERVEIPAKVEIEIEHRAVMLARRDEHRRLAAKEEIVRIVGMEGEWRIRSAGVECEQRQRQGDARLNQRELFRLHNYFESDFCSI